MPAWPTQPAILEVNALCWLAGESAAAGRRLGLGDLPAASWDDLTVPGVDAVWLMGVWERSPEGARVARTHPPLRDEVRAALPGATDADVVGSPRCVRSYSPDPRLGGAAGLARAREELRRRGLRLVLDFVPNHTGLDHHWVAEHPEFFVGGTAGDLAREAGHFFEAGGRVLAHGREPDSPPWPDVAQLNPFHPGQRRAAVRTLSGIASLCDGVRCDMAMLALDEVVVRTWGERCGPPLPRQYWEDVIPAVRSTHPEFLFLAEVYWDLEWELLRLGFDYCYDKRLYDRLAHGDAEGVRRHLFADLAFQRRLLRFTENHDEARAAAAFPGGKNRAAAVVLATVPGAKLLNEGQLEGRAVRCPVVLGRRPDEPPDRDLSYFWRQLLAAARSPAFRDGDWSQCARTGWPDNPSHHHLLAWCARAGGQRRLVVVNYSGWRSQGMVRVPWRDIRGGAWRLTDLDGTVFERDGDALADSGLYVDLPAWGFHVLSWSRRTPRAIAAGAPAPAAG